MDLIAFIEKFPDEASCKAKFKAIRDREGILCKCGSREDNWRQGKALYECKSCGFRTSLKSGTVMHKSKLSFRYWLLSIHLLTATKKGFSSKELQRQLGHKRYQPIWHMAHKLRLAMGSSDDTSLLEGTIELDEGFFSTEIADQEKDKPLKRGRGSQRKSRVLVMIESELDRVNPTKGKGRKAGRLKMKVIPDLKAKTVTNQVKDNIAPGSCLVTDDSRSYVELPGIVDEHKPCKTVDKSLINKVLPWVHIAIANSKRWILSNFHDIKPEYLQFYLNEFCYKFNRRYSNETIFEKLISCTVKHKNTFRYI
jgi:DNA-directed RNA polymerase subunit RPC12/RpoP/transposase-like protein